MSSGTRVSLGDRRGALIGPEDMRVLWAVHVNTRVLGNMCVAWAVRGAMRVLRNTCVPGLCMELRVTSGTRVPLRCAWKHACPWEHVCPTRLYIVSCVFSGGTRVPQGCAHVSLWGRVSLGPSLSSEDTRVPWALHRATRVLGGPMDTGHVMGTCKPRGRGGTARFEVAAAGEGGAGAAVPQFPWLRPRSAPARPPEEPMEAEPVP